MRDPWGKIFFVLLFVIIVAGGAYYFMKNKTVKPQPSTVATTTPAVVHQVIGISVEGRKIDAYTYGSGEERLVFAGGMHGGYEWNSVLLAYQMMDYLALYPQIIPKNLSVTIIPSINPDGLFAVIGKEGRFALTDAPPADDGTGKGRFNANSVDLNRNFDCKWKPESTWRSKVVKAGTSAFSEPESKAVRDFALKYNPSAFIFWHSQSNAVYASKCENGILPETLLIMNTYAEASGYPAIASFDAYPITGDAEGWLASIGIPAITVELKTHQTIEWDKNLAGVKALFDYYSKK
jgi:g-D-glutamyl-meso-diaminopimelate peptidase